jgi:hypothetical protein
LKRTTGRSSFQRELVDRREIPTADAPEDRRRRDRAARASVEEPHQLAGALQLGDVARQQQAVHRTDLERDVIGE